MLVWRSSLNLVVAFQLFFGDQRPFANDGVFTTRFLLHGLDQCTPNCSRREVVQEVPFIGLRKLLTLCHLPSCFRLLPQLSPSKASLKMFLSTSCRYLARLPLATFFPSTVQVRIPEKCGADFGEFITLLLAFPTANISLESSSPVNPDLHFARELLEGTRRGKTSGVCFLEETKSQE